MLVTDRFPTVDIEAVHVDARFTARPTIASSLARLVTALPSVLGLCLIFWISAVLGVISIISVLISESIPHSILAF
ncbi:hypothetical protein BH11MYX2_BH11MYX2_10050 [soil metagenome]